jgi:Domain of unknown function (DU1801)
MEAVDFPQDYPQLPPEMAAIAGALQSLILRIFPQAEITRDKNDAGYGFGRGYKGLVYVISPYRGHVTLGIAHAAGLDDPAGLLKGAGSVHQHVKLTRAEQVQDPELELLLQQALRAARLRFQAGA